MFAQPSLSPVSFLLLPSLPLSPTSPPGSLLTQCWIRPWEPLQIQSKQTELDPVGCNTIPARVIDIGRCKLSMLHCCFCASRSSNKPDNYLTKSELFLPVQDQGGSVLQAGPSPMSSSCRYIHGGMGLSGFALPSLRLSHLVFFAACTYILSRIVMSQQGAFTNRWMTAFPFLAWPWSY